MQIFNIIQGWYNFLLSLDTEEAKRKAKFCKTCEHKVSTYELIKDNKIKEIQGFACKLCGCPLVAKLRSNSKCPKNYF